MLTENQTTGNHPNDPVKSVRVIYSKLHTFLDSLIYDEETMEPKIDAIESMETINEAYETWCDHTERKLADR